MYEYYDDFRERLLVIEESLNQVKHEVGGIDNISSRLDSILEANKDFKERLVHIEDKQNVILVKNKNDRLAEMLNNVQYTNGETFDFGIFGMWFTQNYGAVLTSYAIGKLVESFGYTCIHIDMPQIGGEASAYKLDNPDRVFVEKYMNSTKPILVENAKVLNTICSSFIVASDSLWGGGYDYQLWKLKGILFGEFLNDDKNIMSFSSSFGAWNVDLTDSIERRYISLLLSRFKHISLREKESIDVCRKAFDVDASWTLDPVWLVDVDEYEKFVKGKRIDEEAYIFAYIMKPTKQKMDILYAVGQIMEKKIILVPDMNDDHVKSINYEWNSCKADIREKISVEEWLSGIKYAEFVVTDSYHGMCFSAIFEKQFISLTPRDGMLRFSSLMNAIGLMDRLVEDIDCVGAIVEKDIDYTEVKQKLDFKKESDISELKKALEMCYEDGLFKRKECKDR